MRYRWRTATVAALVVASIASPASAHDEIITDDGGLIGEHQHGSNEGHLEAGSHGVTLVSKLELSNVVEGAVSDVGFHDGFAYLTRFRGENCFTADADLDPPGGVWIVDATDPENPQEVTFLPTSVGSYAGEGSHVISIKTRSFRGDVLAINNETCANGDDLGGITLWDVTDPYNPELLVEHFGDLDVDGVPQEIHSAFMWQGKDKKAYAVMVDDEEPTDIDIVDISDPRAPVLIAEYDLDGVTAPQILQDDLGAGGTFHHDMIVKKIKGRYIMLTSYWDGGYVKLDVTDPTAPVYLADSDFANPDPLLLDRTGNAELPEGNAHQAEFNKDNKFIVAADEDFNPIVGELTDVTSGGTPGRLGSGSDTPRPELGVPIAGNVVYVGTACGPTLGDVVPAGDPAVSDIALVQRGVCTFSEKVATVEAGGGYDAILIFNNQGNDGSRCNSGLSMSVVGNTPTFGLVSREVGLGLLGQTYDEAACLAGTQPVEAAVGTVGDEANIRVYFDGWGYVRLFKNNNGKLKELDQYAIPEAHDPAFAEGFGDLSVHEVAMSHEEDDLGYLSYYSGGLRVIEIDDGEIQEVGHFIDEGGNNFWGVEVFEHDDEEYVAASDRDFGLYIFQYDEHDHDDDEHD